MAECLLCTGYCSVPSVGSVNIQCLLNTSYVVGTALSVGFSRSACMRHPLCVWRSGHQPGLFPCPIPREALTTGCCRRTQSRHSAPRGREGAERVGLLGVCQLDPASEVVGQRRSSGKGCVRLGHGRCKGPGVGWGWGGRCSDVLSSTEGGGGGEGLLP